MISAALLLDGYKISHPDQYPPQTEFVYSNVTPRKSRISNIDHVVVFGIQYWIKKYLIEEWNAWFNKPEDIAINDMKVVLDSYLGENSVNLSRYRELHRLGYLPVRIKALPEGTLCPIGVPLMTIENTLPEFFWVTNMLETLNQTAIWQGITSATIARQFKLLLMKYAKMTGDESFVPFQGHDFSFRGMSSVESACISGSGHLLSFVGTDTIPTIPFLQKYYNADLKNMIGCSVPATEHSVMCAYGDTNEEEAFRHLIEDVYPNGIVSIVSDTWNLWDVLTKIMPSLKDKIMNRDGKVTVRPDCYDEQTEIFTKNGWKFFKDLDDTDLVAQIENGQYTFVKPSKIVKQYYEGDMYHFTDSKGKVNLLVTPNHRMVVNVNGIEKVITAEKMTKHGFHYQKMTRSASAPSNIINKLSDIDRLRIAFQADGSFATNCKSNKIRFSFSKQRKINRLSNLLDRMNIPYNIYDLKDGRKEFNIRLNVNDFTKDLMWVDLTSLTKEWCEEFIEECSYWDSCRRSDVRFKFDSTTKSVVDIIEIIAISAGYGVLKSVYNDNRKDHFSDVYTLHIMKDNTIGGQSWKKEKMTYKGHVYCVKVPSGKILVRRNRSVLVSGNSGDPADIICGLDIDDISPITINKHERKGVIELLWDVFGGTINEKGYKVLDPHVGCIYGDSITLDRAKDICSRLKEKGFASTNIVFGIGSYTYQYNTRDTFSLACKSTWAQINGEAKSLFKDPITDSGTKKSATGLLSVVNDNGLKLLQNVDRSTEQSGELKTVFVNGIIIKEHYLSEIRSRLNDQN